MKATLTLLLLVTLTPAFAQAATPDETALYERAIRLVDEGRYAPARLALQTLLNVYPETGLKADVDAALLYLAGNARLANRQPAPARLAFQTLINLYPESAYAERARKAIEESRR